MEKELELKQVIYNIIVMQIQFGTFRFGEHLPRIEDSAQWLLVSFDTVSSVYRRLKQEGFITMTKSAGTTVKIQYNEQEIKQNIKDFFSCRKDALMDLSQSVCPLLTNAICAGMRKASPQKLEEIERLCRERGPLPPYEMIRHFQNLYGSLNNDMLMRLLWQSFMFYQAPLLSIREHLIAVDESRHPLIKMVELCRKEDDASLMTVVNTEQQRLHLTLCRFYEKYDIQTSGKEHITFSWNSYKKPFQICYSLGLELLIAINRGDYPAGTLLPSLSSLASKKHVSISTVRRTLSLLGDIGATKSINGVGTQVLSPDQISENCDFTKVSVRKRLLDCAQSMHILALSCKEVSRITVTSLDTAAIAQCKERLNTVRKNKRFEAIAYSILDLIIEFSPYQAIRTVYASLFQQLIWGYPLRGIRGSQDEINAYLLPYLDTFSDCLNRLDAEGFSVKFEELMQCEFRYTVDHLVNLGIEEAALLTLA